MGSQRRVLFVGVLLIVLVTIGAAIISLRVRQLKLDKARDNRQLLSHHVKLNVEGFFGERAKALALITAIYRDGLIRSRRDFEYYSRQIFTTPDVFRRVSLANPDYQLVFQSPPAQLSHSLKSYPDRYAFAEKARMTRRLTVTDPVHLVPDGRLALAVYSPVFDGPAFKGIVIGLVDIADFVEKQLAPAFRGAPFKIATSSGRRFYSSPGLPDDFRSELALRIALGDNAWLISAGVPPSSPKDAAFTREVFLVGLILAVAICLALLYLAQSNQLDLARRKLVSAVRLATLGELAATIAHEIRNPLSALANCIGSLKRSVPPGGEDEALLSLCTKEVFRLNQIVSDFIAFSRPASPSLRPVRLDSVLDEVTLAFCKDGRWSSRVRVVRPRRDVYPVIQADPDMLRQVLWNLMTNAAQAISGEGRIILDCFSKSGEAFIRVSDDGHGIPETIQPKVFEPFFSTKATGMGLGLSIVKNIVSDHGGSVNIRSREGEGAEIQLTFRLLREELTHVSTACA